MMRLEETRNSRTLEVRFTDNAVENFSEPLTAYLSGGFTEVVRTRNRPGRIKSEHPIEDQLPLLSPGDEEIIDVQLAPHNVSAAQHIESDDDSQRLHSIFSYEDDRLRLKDSRIKADKKIEYVARLTTLFVYAHELEGRLKVPRVAVNTFLTEATLYDANARKWLATTTDLMSDGNAVELSVPGRERAVETLRRNLDPTVTGSFVLGASSRTRTAKQETREGEDGAISSSVKSAKRRLTPESKKIAAWVERWKAAGISVDAYAVLKDKNAGDRGLVGLWAIRKALGEDGKVVTRVQLAQFLYQAFEIKLTDAAYSSALKRPGIKGKVIHLGGTRFQITPEGMAYVEQMIGPSLQSAGTPTSVNGTTTTVQ